MAKSEKNRSQKEEEVPRKVQIEEKRACMIATNTDGSVVALMSGRELSDYLGVSRRTVRRYVKNGIIPTINIGGIQRFDVIAVRAALERNT